jgi:hypothetical protein
MNDFVSTYQYEEYHNHYDAVVTCFFIDTAINILEYLLIIDHILKPGGLWINVGPLHYHRPTSFFYTYQQLKDIITQVMKFDILHEERITCLYTSEHDISMKPEVYKVPLLVVRKQILSTTTTTEIKNKISSLLSNDNNNNEETERSSSNTAAIIQDEDEEDPIVTFNNVNFILKR